MPFYRKKPVIVEARQFTNHNGIDLAIWCKGEIYWDGGGQGFHEYITIPTLEGNMRSCPGDYIVKGSQFGEFWSVKKEIFEATVEPK